MNSFFEKLSLVVYNTFFSKPSVLKNKRVADNLKLLNPAQDSNELIKKYYLGKIKNSIQIFSIIIVMVIIAGVSNYGGKFLFEGKYVKRNYYGAGDYNIDLDLNAGEIYDGTYNLNVKEQRYSYNEISEIVDREKENLERLFLNSNESLDYINKPVNLIKSICDGLIDVSWEFNIQNVFDSDGSILEDNVSEDGTLVEIKAKMQYYDYAFYYIFNCIVYEPAYSKEELLLKQLGEKLNEAESESQTNEFFELPTDIDGTKITWKEPFDNSGLMLVFLGIVVIIALYFVKDNDLEKKTMARKKEMMIDYPEIISKFSLMMSAGMPTYMVWERIVDDYIKKKECGGKYRFAYEEMLITLREMQNGISELRAYDRFGKRCKVQSYLKFSTLIMQNIKMGTKGFIQMLNEEVDVAFNERKNLAKKLGEEAGTKLLFPMLLMLMVVLIIIMAPAFMSFKI